MMGDKTNTKHGNMVALPNFGIVTTSGEHAGQSYLIWPTPATVDGRTAIGLPFSGHVVAFVHTGDYAYAGTWTAKLKKNGDVLPNATVGVTQETNIFEANSPQAIPFSAGDTLGVSCVTDANFVTADNGEAFVTIYVMFGNS